MFNSKSFAYIGVLLSILATPVVAASPRISNCTQYIARGKTSNVGTLNFIGNGDESFVHNLGGLAGYPMKVDIHHKTGNTFKFQSCRDSIGISQPSHQSYCSDKHGTPPCYVAWTDNVRIIDPNSGTCLTAIQPADQNYPITAMYFKTCNNSAGYNIYEQLFTTQQVDTYSGANFSGKLTYGSVLFVQFGFESEPGFFYTDTDNMTILSPQSDFGVEYPPPNAVTGYIVIDK